MPSININIKKPHSGFYLLWNVIIFSFIFPNSSQSKKNNLGQTYQTSFQTIPDGTSQLLLYFYENSMYFNLKS